MAYNKAIPDEKGRVLLKVKRKKDSFHTKTFIFIQRKWLMAATVGIFAAVAVFCLIGNKLFFNGFPTLNQSAKDTKETVVIDAGHGGFDPGKVGTDGSLEKEINLAIAKKVEKYLSESGYTVYMTRTDDRALCEGNEKSKKLTDMKNRVQFIEEVKPSLTVSIHQNSFSAQTKGAQVFYYAKSEPGKELAAVMQATIKDLVQKENQRVEKPNDSYYMLRKVSGPLIIVECGFLSNPEEEALLKDDTYQQRMALAICEGIENFLYL